MKLTPLLPFLLTTLLFINCSKDETPAPNPDAKEQLEPKPEVYFTLNVADNYTPQDNEDWIIIHDNTGKILDYSQLENGSNYIFEALENDLPNSFSITTFRHVLLTSSMASRFFLSTYPEILKGSIWNYSLSPNGGPRETNPTVPGLFSIEVQNIPGYIESTLSSLENISPIRSYTYQRGSNNLSLQEIDIYEDNNYLLSILDSNNDLKYTTVENVENNLQVVLNYNDFLNFDNYVIINLPNQEIEYTYFINGLAADIEYIGNDGFMYQHNLILSEGKLPFNQLKLGYLDEFAKNKTYFSITMKDEGYSYSYNKQGTRPEAIVIPEKPSFVINGESINNFEFTTSMEYLYSSSSWFALEETSGPPPELGGPNPDSTNWTVFAAPNSNPKIDEIPSQITAKYPNLNLDSLIYKNTNLYLKSRSYSQLISSFTTLVNQGNLDYETEVLNISN